MGLWDLEKFEGVVWNGEVDGVGHNRFCSV
jgi:hypothetical protein